MATVNDWDDAAKLRWIRTRLVGRAQKAYSHFPDIGNYGEYNIDKVTEGTWVVEDCRAPKSEILVACAVVHPGSSGFPKRVWQRNHCL